jgi:hypothetical protein
LGGGAFSSFPPVETSAGLSPPPQPKVTITNSEQENLSACNFTIQSSQRSPSGCKKAFGKDIGFDVIGHRQRCIC